MEVFVNWQSCTSVHELHQLQPGRSCSLNGISKPYGGIGEFYI